jgi:hypothetical protein
MAGETRVGGSFNFRVTIPVTINVSYVEGDYNAARQQAWEMLKARLKAGTMDFPGMGNNPQLELVDEHCYVHSDPWGKKGRVA